MQFGYYSSPASILVQALLTTANFASAKNTSFSSISSVMRRILISFTSQSLPEGVSPHPRNRVKPSNYSAACDHLLHCNLLPLF